MYVMTPHMYVMIKAIFTSIVYYKLQRFTERIPLNLAESSVEALYRVGYSPLLLLTLDYRLWIISYSNLEEVDWSLKEFVVRWIII